GTEDLDYDLGRQRLPDSLRNFCEKTSFGVGIAPTQKFPSGNDPGGPFSERIPPGSRHNYRDTVQAALAACWVGDAARATSTMAENALASCTAMSASTLRSTSTPARRR